MENGDSIKGDLIDAEFVVDSNDAVSFKIGTWN